MANGETMDLDEILVALTLGTRKPQDEFEEQLLKEIIEIREKGGIVEIPGEIV